MKSTTSIGLATWLFVSSALATAGTVEYAIQKQQTPRAAELSRREVKGTVEPALLTDFNNYDGLAYYINLTVGTPGQLQTVILDTGSSDFWLVSSNAPFCTTDDECVGGTFDTSKSSTYRLVTEGALNVTYGDGSNYTGNRISDVVQIGDLVISGAQLGVALEGGSASAGGNTGIMGVGYSDNEGIQTGDKEYPNFVEVLVGSGAIASRLYSLYLNELSSFGSILFGGVDTEKYSGDLTTLNLVSTINDEIGDFYLSLDNVTATKSDGTTQTLLSTEDAIYVLPDSGTTAWIVPSTLYSELLDITGVEKTALTIACNKIPDTNLTLAISGNGTNTASLQVPLSQMFTTAKYTNGEIASSNGETLCQLMIEIDEELTSELGFYLLGDAIMRAGYWVYDLDNGQISLAQAKLSANASNVVAVEAGLDGLKNAANQEDYLTAVQNVSVAPTVSAKVSYSLSTAASAVGETAGPEATLGLSSAASGLAVGVSGWCLVVCVAVGALLI